MTAADGSVDHIAGRITFQDLLVFAISMMIQDSMLCLFGADVEMLSISSMVKELKEA